MRFDQPPRPSPSLVPSPERVAAFTAELRARAEKEMAAAFGRTTKPAAVPQLLARPNIKYAATDWVWPDRIARGKLTLLGGAPGIGKSTFAMNVSARVTAGDAWPCGEGVAPRGAVLLIAPHGDPDVFMLRFLAAGGDETRLRALCEVKDGGKARPFDLKKDLAALEPLIDGITDLRLIVIDAVQLPGGRGPAAARQADALFQSLAALASRHNVAVLAITQQAGDDYRGGKPILFGTLPLTAARAAFMVETHPGDEFRRVLLQVKNELSIDPGALVFRMPERRNLERPEETAAGVAFEEARIVLSARTCAAQQTRGFNSAKADGIEFLGRLFAKATDLAVREIEEEARAAGLLGTKQALSQCRALRDARVALGLIVIRTGFGKDGAWVWTKAIAGESASPPPQAQLPMDSPPPPSAAPPNPQPMQVVPTPPLHPIADADPGPVKSVPDVINGDKRHVWDERRFRTGADGTGHAGNVT